MFGRKRLDWYVEPVERTQLRRSRSKKYKATRMRPRECDVKGASCTSFLNSFLNFIQKRFYLHASAPEGSVRLSVRLSVRPSVCPEHVFNCGTNVHLESKLNRRECGARRGRDGSPSESEQSCSRTGGADIKM